jgi:hypothetical protein
VQVWCLIVVQEGGKGVEIGGDAGSCSRRRTEAQCRCQARWRDQVRNSAQSHPSLVPPARLYHLPYLSPSGVGVSQRFGGSIAPEIDLDEGI